MTPEEYEARYGQRVKRNAAGPSDDYKLLLAGHITPEEYVRRLKADVDARFAADQARRIRDLSAPAVSPPGEGEPGEKDLGDESCGTRPSGGGNDG